MHDNAYIIEKLKLIGQLLEIQGENPFKTRAYPNGARALAAQEETVGRLIETNQLSNINGIGSALSDKIKAIYLTGTCPLLERLESEIPPGVVEMLKIKGLGSAKITHIWMKMGIETLGELLYACEENRLMEEKGFGAKTQENIRNNILFVMDNRDLFYYAKLFPIGESLVAELKKILPAGAEISFTGDLRRKMPILSGIDLLVSAAGHEAVRNWFKQPGEYYIAEEKGQELLAKIDTTNIPIRVEFADGNFAQRLWETTGNPEHLAEVKPASGQEFASEAELYQSAGLPYIEPELREGRSEISLAQKGKLPQLVEQADLKGILHNHSTWSDGLHTLEEMAVACRDLGMDYFGICDHSASAFYANGLSAGRVEQQHLEIDQINQKLAPFRILKGIESDIRTDGSLDYEPEVLAKFDFIVASVHSQLNMDEATATRRLITAIENPYTSILGHPTGRLNLVRKGYPIDHVKVIDACAANGVAIEINAHPARLDLDWTWIPYALEKGVMISINPDAHKKGGLTDIKWGLAAARKGYLTAAMTLNALSLEDILAFFEKRRSGI
ncbi:MAG: DNA polymerase/3'-5' exonuclease PolX [Bacteroidia bacterium]|nr:DNA polymerase/3'-5' exonuclease PolX [Bacteroidia bacterium]